jgi:hypothetical protein
MSEFELSTVQFSRLTKRGVMLGLSLPQLVTLGIGLVTAVGGLYVTGGAGLVWTAPVWGFAAVTATVPVGGRKIVEWAPMGLLNE